MPFNKFQVGQEITQATKDKISPSNGLGNR